MQIKHHLIILTLFLFAVPIYAIAIDSCRKLAEPNAVYTLNATITPAQVYGNDCFDVTAPNVTLDCRSFLIGGPNAPASIGVYSDQVGTVVENCKFSGFFNDVYYNGSYYGTIANISVESVGSKGSPIMLEYSSHNSLSNMQLNSQYSAVILESSDYNTLDNMAINSTGGGLLVLNSSYNTFTDINASAVGNTQLYSIVIAGKGNSFSGIRVNSKGNGIVITPSYTGYSSGTVQCYGNGFANADVTSGYDGIDVASSSNNVIAESTIRSNGTALEFFQLSEDMAGASDNIARGNTLISMNGSGNLLYLDNLSSGNLFYLNYFTDTSGLYAEDDNGNNFYNTTLGIRSVGNTWYNVVNGSVNVSKEGGVYSSKNSQGKLSGNIADYGPGPFSDLQPKAVSSTITDSGGGTAFYTGSTLVGRARVVSDIFPTMTVYYRWYLNGSLNSSGSCPNVANNTDTNIANITGGVEAGQSWVLEVIANGDVFNSSPVNSSSIAVSSPPPTPAPESVTLIVVGAGVLVILVCIIIVIILRREKDLP